MESHSESPFRTPRDACIHGRQLLPPADRRRPTCDRGCQKEPLHAVISRRFDEPCLDRRSEIDDSAQERCNVAARHNCLTHTTDTGEHVCCRASPVIFGPQSNDRAALTLLNVIHKIAFGEFRMIRMTEFIPTFWSVQPAPYVVETPCRTSYPVLLFLQSSATAHGPRSIG